MDAVCVCMCVCVLVMCMYVRVDELIAFGNRNRFKYFITP